MAASVARTKAVSELAVMLLSCAVRSGPFDHADSVRASNKGNMREPDEQAMLDHARDMGKPDGQPLRVRNSRQRGVQDEMPLVRDESVAVLAKPKRRRAWRTR